MTKRRRHFTVEAKGAVVRRHLIDRVPVPDPCDEYGLEPTEPVLKRVPE